VRGIKQLSEPCFYYLQTRIVSKRRKKNSWRYLNFADFFEPREGGQHSLVVCCITSFFLKRLADFSSCITDLCNDAKVTVASLPISVNTFAETPNVAKICSVILKDL
jgi:hypothetical protein